MALSEITKITGPGIHTLSNVLSHNIKSSGIITATKFVGPIEGSITATDATFSGNVSIAGTLTYEDVTNIDSVGIITAPAVDVDDFLDVGSNIKLGNAGVITATSFRGDGSQLTGIVAGLSTISGVVNVVNDLDVDGHTNLDNVSIAGVTTFASNVFLGDNDRILFGDGGLSDAHVRYDGNHLQFGVASGQFRVSADTSSFVNYAGSQTLATINSTGVSIPLDLDVDGHTNLDNVSIAGVSTFSGTTNINTSGNEKLILSGSSNPYIQFQEGTTNKAYLQWSSGSGHIQLGNEANSTVLRIISGETGLVYRVGTNNRTVWTSGNDGASSGLDADLLDGQEGSYYSPNVGITTNLSGTFTASAGSPSTINTFGYGSGDIVVEYTVFIKNGSDFQSQKLLAMRDGTTIHSTQFAVMYSSSLLVQLDATISSGNILLRATPETGVSGSTTYKIKREVM